ncbi:MAG: LacI family DNA-binding transcriptional regulator [Chloroflexi bacterium]|nr:LacI family DNA-binding transcriptional regulator [Chloroflexota bacterium]
MGRPGRVTIHDIAREAGVSHTTVSRALNDKGELDPETRARVRAVAERLRYTPSSVARALASGRTRTLGVLITDNASPTFAEALRGVEEVANAAGFGLLLCNSADSQDQALRCLAMLMANRVDGILVTPVQTDQRDLTLLRQSGIPFVLLFRHFADVVADCVVTDSVEGGLLATGHLLDLGHRRVGHIGGPPHISTAQERLAGYRRALAKRDLPFDETLVASAAFSVAGGHQAALALLDRPDRPTSIFAATDLQAIGVLKAARTLGLRIPDDLPLVGGDDIELAEFLEVPLTTFHQPSRAIGARGAELLLARIQGEAGEPRRVIFAPRLIIRRSSGCKG